MVRVTPVFRPVSFIVLHITGFFPVVRAAPLGGGDYFSSPLSPDCFVYKYEANNQARCPF